METEGEDHLLVVNEKEASIIICIVHYRSIIGIYNQALRNFHEEINILKK